MKYLYAVIAIMFCVAPFTGEEVNQNINPIEHEITIEETTEVQEELVEEKPEKKHLGEFELTFYSKEQFPNSPTATGVMPIVGRTIAVDPSVIPYGTVVEIDGFGIRCAEDTGGAIKGNKIDVFVQTTAEALQLGRKHNVDVWLVE